MTGDFWFTMNRMKVCKYRLNGNACNLKEKPNHNKCRCKCKDFVDWKSSKKRLRVRVYYMYTNDKTWKLGESLDIKISTCKEPIIDDLVLTSEHEMLGTTDTLQIVEKKVIDKNDLCFIHTILLLIKCLLLLVIVSINCYFYIG